MSMTEAQVIDSSFPFILTQNYEDFKSIGLVPFKQSYLNLK